MKVKFKSKAFILTEAWTRGGVDGRTFSGRRVAAGEVLDLPEEMRDMLPSSAIILDDPEPEIAPKPRKASNDKDK